MSENMPTHLALRSGGHACSASYPALHSTDRRDAVTCVACLSYPGGRIIYRPEQPHACPHPRTGTEPCGTAWECNCGDVWMVDYGTLEWRRVKRLRADWKPWWRRLLRHKQGVKS